MPDLVQSLYNGWLAVAHPVLHCAGCGEARPTDHTCPGATS